MRHLILFILSSFLLAGCSGKPGDARLLEISEKVSDHPEDMLARLDSIEVGSLDEADRYFHALLTIKAQDKAFIRHTSDSVVVKVIDYYSRHKGSGLYTEALYYGGRVYSDIGDAPTALRYFHDALDALPDGMDNAFRGRILSQAGDLLNSLHLYNEASGYLKNAITIFLQMEDSISAMRSIQFLGAVEMHAGHIDSADHYFRKAREIGSGISHRDTVIQDMYMAGTRLYRGDISDALRRIRLVLRSIPEKKRDIVYSYAAQIYLKAGIPDTAYLYSVALTKSGNNDRRKTGYGMLLRPELRRYSSTDSLLSFAIAHEKTLDEYLSRHDGQQVEIQSSLYNYEVHERDRRKAEESKQRYMYAAGFALIFVLILFVGLLYLRNRKMKLRIDYHKSLDNIEQLRNTLSSTEYMLRKYEKTFEELDDEKKLRQKEKKEGMPYEENYNIGAVKKETEEDRVRERLKERLLALQRAGKAKKNDPKEILSSTVYDRLQEVIESKTALKVDDKVWVEIENAVLHVSSDFKSNLSLLIGGKIKSDVYHMALLVRCGFGPTDTGTLLGRSKGAVSSRRGYICEKIFGEKYGGRVMDDIINLL